MALSNATLSGATATSLECSVESDLAGGVLYYLVTTGAGAAIEDSAVVNFGVNAGPASVGANPLPQWTNLFPSANGQNGNNYNKVYYLHVIHDEDGAGNFGTKVVSPFLATLNDGVMRAPSLTTRYLPPNQSTISRDDPLIQDWLLSGGNVAANDSLTSLPESIPVGQYTVNFSNGGQSTDSVLEIRSPRRKVGISPRFTSIVKTDGGQVTDPSEYWGLYKAGNYLFAANGNAANASQKGGIRVYDVSDVEGGSADTPVFTDQHRGPAETITYNGQFLRTVVVIGTPEAAGAEAHVIYRTGRYPNPDAESMIYVYDISGPPAGWGLKQPWATYHDHEGGPGSPAFSVPLMSDMAYDGAHIFTFTQKNGLRKYDPANIGGGEIAFNNDYSPRQHETQGGTVDSDPNGYVYTAAYANGIRIVPKSDLVDTQYGIIGVDRYQPGNYALRPWDAVLSADENFLFVSLQSTVDSSDPVGKANPGGLGVYDVHDPEKPILIGSFIMPQSDWDVYNGRHDQACVRITRLDWSGREYALLGNQKKGVAIYDVSDPTRPTYLGSNMANLDTVGAEPDGIGYMETWQDNGKIYAAYGDYGSLVNGGGYGSRQLYIDELTLEGAMAFTIGHPGFGPGTGTNTALDGAYGSKSTSKDANTRRIAQPGDYIDQVHTRLDMPGGNRSVSYALYEVDGAGELTNFVTDFTVDYTSVVTRDVYTSAPLPGGRFYLPNVGTTYGIALVRDEDNSTGTNTGVITVNGEPGVTLPGSNSTATNIPGPGVTWPDPYAGSDAAFDMIAVYFSGDTDGSGGQNLSKSDFIGTWNVTAVCRDAMLEAAGNRRQVLFDAMAPYKSPANTTFPVPVADMIGTYTLDAAAVEIVLESVTLRGHRCLTAMVLNNGATRLGEIARSVTGSGPGESSRFDLDGQFEGGRIIRVATAITDADGDTDEEENLVTLPPVGEEGHPPEVVAQVLKAAIDALPHLTADNTGPTLTVGPTAPTNTLSIDIN